MADAPFSYALANPLSFVLDKPRAEFRRADFLKIIEAHDIERITFHYMGLDGKLKEMKIPVVDRGQAELILAEGERVDGSSLFKGLVDIGLSDLYVAPVYRTAFLNPFSEGSLDFVCRYITDEGEFAPFAPDNILGRWLIRNIASKHGCVATFTPKIEEDVAGNGMHIHLELLRDKPKRDDPGAPGLVQMRQSLPEGQPTGER